MSDFVVRPSLKPVLPWYIALVATIVWVLYMYNQTGRFNVLWGLVPVLLLLRALVAHSRVRMAKLTVGGGKLRLDQGLFDHTTRSMELRKVQDVSVNRTLTQRMIGTGDLRIETAGDQGGIRIANIDRPQFVADRILEAASQAASQQL
jgi:uncharacterized membrane protein YdbT with pleckstrin-like domain